MLNPTPSNEWTILRQCRPYSQGQNACDVCFAEKLEIVVHIKDPNNINKKQTYGLDAYTKKNFQLGSITSTPSAGRGLCTASPSLQNKK